MDRVLSSVSRLACCALVMIAVESRAFAQVTTFFGNDNPRGSFTNSSTANSNFLASFALTGTDNLDSYPIFAPTSLSFGPATAATANNNASFVINDASIGATWSISPSNLLVNFGSPVPTVFDISRPVNGFGLYIVNAGDAVANQFTFQLFSKQTGITKNIPVNANTDGTGSPFVFGPGRGADSVLFFGVRDTDPFDTITILAAADGTQDGLLYDDISIGFVTGVPEPSTYALIGCVMAAGFGRYRYIKRKQRKEDER